MLTQQTGYSAIKNSELMSLVKELAFDRDEEEPLRRPMLDALKHTLEHALQLDLAGFLRTSRYERKKDRNGYRNGNYQRSLVTRFGTIPLLTVPRPRKGRLPTKVFKRYQRRQEEVNTFIRKLFLAGVSTREVGDVLEALLETRPSATTVSNVCKTLDAEVKKFKHRPLDDQYKFLILDGVWVKVNTGYRVVKKVLIVAYGIRRDGIREVIGFHLASAESERECEILLLNLRRRGLLGENLQLIAIDGSRGMKNAVQTIYPDVKLQRCWVHKLRNVMRYLKVRQREACLGEARVIYRAESYRAAIEQFRLWKYRWQEEAPKAVACLEQDLEELLTFLQVVKEPFIRIKVRTTNAIERIFRELRKRVRPMCSFTGSSSCERIVCALFINYNKKWKEKRLWKLKQITQNT